MKYWPVVSHETIASNSTAATYVVTVNIGTSTGTGTMHPLVMGSATRAVFDEAIKLADEPAFVQPEKKEKIEGKMTVYLSIDPTADPVNFNERDNILARDWTEAKHVMMTGAVDDIRLPYWFGTCEACKTENARAAKAAAAAGVKIRKGEGCPHMGTGLDFFRWLDQADFWPKHDEFYITNGSGEEVQSIYNFADARRERRGQAA